MKPLTILAETIPTGHTTDDVKAYYDFMYRQYLENNLVNDWAINWAMAPRDLLFTAASLIIYFYVFGMYYSNPLRPGQALYDVESIGGVLTERNGKPPLFSRMAWTAIIVSGMYYVVDHALTGQVY